MRAFFSAVLAGPVIAVMLLAGTARLDTAIGQTVPESRAEISLSFAPVVKLAAPAVVNVYADRIVRQSGFFPFADDPFFGRLFGEHGFLGQPRERVQKSLGSGVVIDGSGLIVTNNHVIKGGTDIRVVLPDRREFAAEIALTDERTDLAVLKVNPGHQMLPAIPLGDSDALEVGDLVLAIGNPFAVGQTVTSGIVSALARTEIGVTDYQFFIQTDAPINPGNSGGALVDMAGRLVGINTAIYSRSGGSIGIGFAIPVNMVKAVIRSIDTNGRIVRPWSGAELQDVTSDIAQALGFDRPQGALVTRLHPLSPLHKAGMRPGDVVIAVDDKPIESAREFAYRLATSPVGETARITYIRGGMRNILKVDLIAPPEQPPREETLIEGNNPADGLLIANLSPAVADELGMGHSAAGVVVVDVRSGHAERFGFRKGDILVEVNGVEIDRVGTLRKVLNASSGRWDMAVERNGQVLRVRFSG